MTKCKRIWTNDNGTELLNIVKNISFYSAIKRKKVVIKIICNM